MSRTKQETNRVLVLEAFDALFKQRDYVAAERYWSPHYIQHSAHIAPGRGGLFNLIKSIPPTLKYEPGTIVAAKAHQTSRSAHHSLKLPMQGASHERRYRLHRGRGSRPR